MRTYWNAELGCHQENRQYLVDASKPATVNLAKSDCLSLKKLFEDDAILALLTSCYANWRDCPCNRGVTYYVTGTCRLFYPPRREFCQLSHVLDSFTDILNLVGIHHQLPLPADFLPHDGGSVNVIFQICSNFDFEVSPSCGDGFPAESAEFLIRISEPTGRCRIGRVAPLSEPRVA